MTWTKLPDKHFDRLDVMKVSRSARLLDIEATVFSNGILSDGRIPAVALRRFTDSPDAEADAAELVAVGRWEIAEDGWQIADWTEDQEPADRVRKRQKENAARQTRSRAHRAGDHTLCDARWCQFKSHDVTDPVTDPASNDGSDNESHDSPTHPDPARPEGPGDGESAPATVKNLTVDAGDLIYLRLPCPHGTPGGHDLTTARTFKCLDCRIEAGQQQVRR